MLEDRSRIRPFGIRCENGAQVVHAPRQRTQHGEHSQGRFAVSTGNQDSFVRVCGAGAARRLFVDMKSGRCFSGGTVRFWSWAAADALVLNQCSARLLLTYPQRQSAKRGNRKAEGLCPSAYDVAKPFSGFGHPMCVHVNRRDGPPRLSGTDSRSSSVEGVQPRIPRAVQTIASGSYIFAVRSIAASPSMIPGFSQRLSMVSPDAFFDGGWRLMIVSDTMRIVKSFFRPPGDLHREVPPFGRAFFGEFWPIIWARR